MLKTLKYKLNIWKVFIFHKPFRISIDRRYAPPEHIEVWNKALKKRGWICVGGRYGWVWHHPKKDWPPRKYGTEGYSGSRYYSDIVTEVISSDYEQREKDHFNVIDEE